MIEMIVIGVLLFLGAPLIAVLLACVWFMGSNELNREPTKEEWKQGKRRRTWY